MRPAEVNGQPGFITYMDGRLQNVLALDIADDRIRGVYIVVNPDKLKKVQGN